MSNTIRFKDAKIGQKLDFGFEFIYERVDDDGIKNELGIPRTLKIVHVPDWANSRRLLGQDAYCDPDSNKFVTIVDEISGTPDKTE